MRTYMHRYLHACLPHIQVHEYHHYKWVVKFHTTAIFTHWPPVALWSILLATPRRTGLQPKLFLDSPVVIRVLAEMQLFAPIAALRLAGDLVGVRVLTASGPRLLLYLVINAILPCCYWKLVEFLIEKKLSQLYNSGLSHFLIASTIKPHPLILILQRA